MTKWVSLSFVAAALFGAGLVSTLEEGRTPVSATPFWQLQGASPAAGETEAIVQLRQAARQDHAEPLVVALRSR